MNVLSLFDGISCGRIALERAGIPVTNYYASEIDKYAIQISKKNYPEIKHIGSVTKCYIPKNCHIDLLIGGSPCQGFSFAGTMLNFEDPRSKLFFEYVRILKEIRRYNPDVKFLLENVIMEKWCENLISELLEVKPLEINSQLVSAQQRKRLYWTNIDNNIKQPAQRNIVLKDIVLEKELNYENTFYEGNFKEWLLNKNITSFKSCNGMDVKVTKEKTFLANERRVSKTRGLNGKSTCLTCSSISVAGSGGIALYINGIHRKISSLEAERLQNVPDNYTHGLSDNKRIHALGNGWNVNTVQHIFSYLK